ncbi:MAG: hypothetical protein CMJ78_27865 [Planctomycetaceae bacterium]|nr:hypothetical protein [Planctomycetaceae bacterium]
MSNADREKWDGKYHGKSVPQVLAPNPWLIESVSDLAAGRCLDLACGLGHDAIWLAQQGWSVDAVDISPKGLRLASKFADQHNVRVNWIAADLDEFAVSENQYQLVTVFRFLDRTHLPSLVERALAPGGLLIYETFSFRQLDRDDSHIKNPAFVLQPEEFKSLYANLEVIEYAEVELPDRSVARLLAKRPATCE